MRCNRVVLLLVAALTVLPAAAAAQITNGGFEQPGPTGANEPSLDGWRTGTNPPGADAPAAEPGGAGGSAGRARVGDDPRTPGKAKPGGTGIGQDFNCPGTKRFCNITFKSAYHGAPGEIALVGVQSAGGGRVDKVIPADAVFTPHGISVVGCGQKFIAFGVVSANAGVGIDSTLWVDDVACSCDDVAGTDDLKDLSTYPDLSEEEIAAFDSQMAAVLDELATHPADVTAAPSH